MNYGMIKYTLGWILMFEACFFAVPMITSVAYFEWWDLFSFFISSIIASSVGLLCVMKKPKNKILYSRDGLVIVALSWIFLSLFGAIPFVISGAIPSFVDALFESASGFTTTGATILSEVESLSHAVLIWRSFTHWVGGMGVLVFILAFLPLSGAQNLHIMRAESTGPSVSKLVPKMRTTALILYVIYFAMTVIMFIVLLFGEMSLFEAINTAFATAGTGGFGLKNDSFASFSPYTQIVVTVFMLLFSVNFSSYYLLYKFRLKDAINLELRSFVYIVAIAIAIVTVNLYSNQVFSTVSECLRHAAFNVASIISTTGFATTDFALWPAVSLTVIAVIMFIGGCAGSTAGGIKVTRFVILGKGVKRELDRAIHPRQVKLITIDGRPADSEVVRSVNAYIACYILIFVTSLLAISFENHDLITNFTAVSTTLNNVGPGLADVGPTSNFGFFSIPSKLIFTFNMLAGRLELLPMLLLFAPSTWKK